MASFTTQLAPAEEAEFQSWVKAKRIPFDPSPNADYDMRGFWKAMKSGDKRATSAISAYDGQPHFPDTWKTPYHHTFSNESIYATKDAPHWEGDRLIDKSGKVIADETPQVTPKGTKMSLSKADYEKVLGRTLTDTEFARLSNGTVLNAEGTNREKAGGRDSLHRELEEAQMADAEAFALQSEAFDREQVEKMRRDADDAARAKANKPLVQGLASTGVPMKEASKSVPYKPAWNSVGPTEKSIKTTARTEPTLPAAPKPKPLNEIAKQGTPMTSAGNQVPFSHLWSAVGPTEGPTLASNASKSPALPAAPAPTAAPAYASGMTVQPEQDEYSAVISDARKKWGL